MHGLVTLPMILVCCFHFWYIADYYFHEEAILTTWDIKHENFGWMLCWGDLVWVPFTYTIQAFLPRPAHPRSAVVGDGRHRARSTSSATSSSAAPTSRSTSSARIPTEPIWGKPAEYIKTARGSLLLTSGWWGHGASHELSAAI